FLCVYGICSARSLAGIRARGLRAVRLWDGIYYFHGLPHVLGTWKIQDVALRHLNGDHGDGYDVAGGCERLASGSGRLQNIFHHRMSHDDSRHADHPVYSEGLGGKTKINP